MKPKSAEKNDGDSLDILTVFIIIMGICSVAIGVWALVLNSRLAETEEQILVERQNLTRMMKIVADPENKKYWGSFKNEQQRDVTPETLGTYLTEMENRTGITSARLGTVHDVKRKTYVEHTVEQRINNITFADLAAYVLNVENYAPEVAAKEIRLSSFPRDLAEGEIPVFNVTIKWNIFTPRKS